MSIQTAVMETPEAGAAPGEGIDIDTRFGPITFDQSNTFDMPHGMLGFSDRRSFGLANLSAERYGHFMLLQSLEDAELSFLVLPLAVAPDMIAEADLREACEALGYDVENAIVMLIATARKDDSGSVTLSVNLRAPIIIDAQNQTGRQYVLNNVAYPIRHVLNGGE